jgi:hypothetical protein
MKIKIESSIKKVPSTIRTLDVSAEKALELNNNKKTGNSLIN